MSQLLLRTRKRGPAAAVANGRVSRAVERAVRSWRRANPRSAAHFEDDSRRNNGQGPSPVIGGMYRRQQMITRSSEAPAPLLIEEPEYNVSTVAALARLLKWVTLMLAIGWGLLVDRLLNRNDIAASARRLRMRMERMGGTFVKFGQQAAMRIDLLPWEYCVELSSMLDRMNPFPLEEALATVERATGKPWDEIFARFDPEPVGSASVACVYQADLMDGTRVAVKIRRPGIGELFAADFRVLDWLARFVEFLTILRPGFTSNLRAELRETLMEELEFAKEARFQDIFRRNSRKSDLDFFSAPKVYFEFSSGEMIVQEFVSGMWLWEVIAAVELNDPKGLAMLKELNIEPKLVAKNIMWSSFWSMGDNLFFHADPHPANILVQRDSKLIYVDFGSCGSFNGDQRIAMERGTMALIKGDAEGMARATLKLMEPFAAVDVEAVTKQLESDFTRVITIFRTKSKYTEWWERTTARQWLAFVRLTRKFNMPLNLRTLRMIRATLLYDTLVMRLDREADRYLEYNRFLKHRAGLVRKKYHDQFQSSPKDTLFLRLEELLEMGDDVLLQAQHLTSSPVMNFGSIVDKWIFTASVMSRTAARLLWLTILALAAVFLSSAAASDPLTAEQLLLKVVTNGAYMALAALIVILNLRHIYLRLADRDTS
jgi:predicted unusual protein kinase regulating ubiquinone biosynthesis (AarF/ABC1/UbiB family)